MQALRTTNQRLSPKVIRLCTTQQPTRNMSLFPRYIANEFAPMFRLMDDYAAHRSSGSSFANDFGVSAFKSFTPKFDVKETKETYELHGELPGIQQENVNIEFTDAQTLTIKGRTERVREEGERPAAVLGAGEEQKTLEAENNYHKPSVEEEEGASSQQQVEKADTEQQQQVQQAAPQEQSKYWVSERSVGEFARTFSFPTRVDQEAVKASLKDGVLSIVVPKAQAPTSKKISIE